MLGEENATDAELIETGRRFFTAMYGQPEGTSMSLARHNPYTRKNGKPFHPDKGITTYGSKSAVSHEESSHARDVESSRSARSSPILDITKFGWDMKSGLPSPSLDIYRYIYIFTLRHFK